MTSTTKIIERLLSKVVLHASALTYLCIYEHIARLHFESRRGGQKAYLHVCTRAGCA